MAVYLRGAGPLPNPLKFYPHAHRFFYGFIPAGFPSPASDYEEDDLDINQHIIKHPSATFFFRADGESMIGAHIPLGAILVVDRSLRPKNGAIIVAAVDGEFTVKRLEKGVNRIRLLPKNPKGLTLK